MPQQTQANPCAQDADGPQGDIQIPRSPQMPPMEASQVDRYKFSSPPSGPASSITTPPPSTQVAYHAHAVVARTPSPLAALLSSPPPTNKQVSYPSGAATANDTPSPDQIENASVEELRAMVADLSVSLRESRTAAAHYKLQHNMLLIDSSKANNAMAVELAMMQRDIEFMQDSEERRRHSTSSPSQTLEAAAHTALINDLTRQGALLQAENEELRQLLSQTRKSLENRECRVASLEEENERLRHRIRSNREHMNGFIDTVFDRSPASAQNTPGRHSYMDTPRSAGPNRAPALTPGRHPQERRDNNLAFDALLLADKVLSQETATAPSTPKNQGSRQGRSGHVRGTHSLSSLPSTPTRRIQASTVNLRTPTYLSSIVEPTEPPFIPQFNPARITPNRRRRASSDSTITASSEEDEMEERGKANRSRDDDDQIPESSASQAATSMLRQTPKKRKPVNQSKILGKITKPTTPAKVLGDSISPEKRRNLSGIPGPEVERNSMSKGSAGSPKKRRLEAVGLGIGL